jgi:hypothetical protein
MEVPDAQFLRARCSLSRIISAALGRSAQPLLILNTFDFLEQFDETFRDRPVDGAVFGLEIVSDGQQPCRSAA